MLMMMILLARAWLDMDIAMIGWVLVPDANPCHVQAPPAKGL